MTSVVESKGGEECYIEARPEQQTTPNLGGAHCFLVIPQ